MDEELLETWCHGGFDLLDAPHQTAMEIEILGERRKAPMLVESPFDSHNASLRS